MDSWVRSILLVRLRTQVLQINLCADEPDALYASLTATAEMSKRLDQILSGAEEPEIKEYSDVLADFSQVSILQGGTTKMRYCS